MSTVATAWAAFIRALEDARDLQHRGADAHTIADLLRHARELLDIIDDEFADGTPQTVADARAVLAQLRGRRINDELGVALFKALLGSRAPVGELKATGPAPRSLRRSTRLWWSRLRAG